MSTKKLSNIPLSKFRKFLKNQGLNLIRDSKGRAQMTYMNSQPETRNIFNNQGIHAYPHPRTLVQSYYRTIVSSPPGIDILVHRIRQLAEKAGGDWDPLGAEGGALSGY